MSIKRKCPKCDGTDFTSMQYSYDEPEHYDGVSEYICNTCGCRIGRWSGKILKTGEVEKRYGGEDEQS